MMFSKNLVASIKVGGKILRENHEIVAIPFGSEYSIYIKNLATVRALVKVEIDGEDALGTEVIVPANGSVELERFVKNGNFEKGNKFKFIERTANIENHRGIGAEDGLIRIEYKFETVVANGWLGGGSYTWYNSINSNTPVGTVTYGPTITTATSGNYGGMLRSCSLNAFNTVSAQSQSLNQNCCFMENSLDRSVNTDGITVAGSESNQQFTTGAWFPTEAVSHTMVLKLVGEVKGTKVTKPVTVKAKPKCVTCGRVNKATNKFCAECGTALEIFA